MQRTSRVITQVRGRWPRTLGRLLRLADQCVKGRDGAGIGKQGMPVSFIQEIFNFVHQPILFLRRKLLRSLDKCLEPICNHVSLSLPAWRDPALAKAPLVSTVCKIVGPMKSESAQNWLRCL